MVRGHEEGYGCPQEKLIWDMAGRFGWTLEYIEALPMAKLHEYIQVTDGESKARNSLLRKKA